MFSRTRILMLAAIALVGMAIGTANAQVGGCHSIVLPNGTLLTCNVVNGQKVYTDPLGNVYTPSSTGTGTFIVLNTSTNPCTAQLGPQAINITSVDPVLGTITTTADLSRVANASVIRSNILGFEFPATEDIYFYANTTISSRPGRLYRSIQQVHLNSTNVNSFAPHVNERFTLAGQVDFEDVNIPGVIQFSITSLTVTLN